MRKLPFFFIGFVALLFVAASIFPSTAWAAKDKTETNVLDPNGIERLKRDAGTETLISVATATGGVRFISFDGGKAARADLLKSAGSFQERSMTFLRDYGSVFGLKNAAEELQLRGEKTDRIGWKHLSYKQQYFGVPVFAGELKAHYDAAGTLRAVNGTIIPNINVNATPSIKSQDAGQTALVKIGKGKIEAQKMSVQATQLYVYRAGLAKGIQGKNHLVWEVEVGNRSNVREFVYIDAHSGQMVDKITGIVDALDRRAFDGEFEAAVPPSNWPDNPLWVEGDVFPTGNDEADNMILASKETYDLFFNAFGRDSFDGNGGTMDAIFNRGNACPNASWNGVFISFCNGLTTDDITGHEWGHAYTEFTHNLIYQWQPGALNESYSDIFGETIDQINGRGNDANTPRTLGECSNTQIFPPFTTAISPPELAGNYPSGTSGFSPAITDPGITGTVVRANDDFVDGPTGNTANDGCSAGPTFVSGVNSWANAGAIAGNIAFIDRGVCGFGVKALNAQRQGAIAVIIANVAGSGNPNFPPGMGGASPAEAITIPVVSMSFPDGELFRAALAGNPVQVLLHPIAIGNPDDSARWAMGEDSTALGLSGPLRDMWTPQCFTNAGKVSDPEYFCGAGDAGGVHLNSGVPNHAYALLVDGGSYNGKNIVGIGLTKAASIYFRASDVYQTRSSDFKDHADAIEQSAKDLLDVDVPDLLTGDPSGQVITKADLKSVKTALQAVEMRRENPCEIIPLLGQDPPGEPACEKGTKRKSLFKDKFENDTSAWTVSHEVEDEATWTPRDWVVVGDLPDKRKGSAFFADDPNHGNCITTSEGALLHLDSPAIVLPADIGPGTTLTFKHNVATEFGFDGGQLLISVNGGDFDLVPIDNFIYNGYNLADVAWSGTDFGTVQGSWATTIVDLTGLAGAGDTIVLRWDMSSDCGSGVLGWWVDDVKLSTCNPKNN